MYYRLQLKLIRSRFEFVTFEKYLHFREWNLPQRYRVLSWFVEKRWKIRSSGIIFRSSTLEEWEKQSRQNGSRKSSSKLRGTTTTDACSTAKKQARERVRTRLDSPTVVPFPTSPLSEQRAREGEGYIHARIYTCIYIYLGARRCFFFLRS